MFKLIIFLVFFSAQQIQSQAYVPPAALVQPLSPIGIHISIPDEPGIRLVAFHVKINDEFVGLEAGTIARDIVKVTNGRWVYHDKSTKLQKGDTINYWIHVIYNNLGYNLIDQEHVVDDFYDYNGNKIQPCNDNCDQPSIGGTVNNCQTQCYVPPVPLIEPLTPVGIRMSIPDEAGISLVAFHVKFNQEFVGLEAGTIARDIVKSINGRWTYHDSTTQLKKGDTIHYWIHVIYEGLGYNLVDQEYTVKEFFGENVKTTTESSTKSTTTESSVENSTTQSTVENKTTESSVEKVTTTESSDDKKTTKPDVESTTTESKHDKKPKRPCKTKHCSGHGRA